MFESTPTDLSIERLRRTESLVNDVITMLTDNSAEQVSVKIDWDVKTVNGTQELVPVVSISYT